MSNHKETLPQDVYSFQAVKVRLTGDAGDIMKADGSPTKMVARKDSVWMMNPDDQDELKVSGENKEFKLVNEQGEFTFAYPQEIEIIREVEA